MRNIPVFFAVSGLPLIGLAGCAAVQSQVVDGSDDTMTYSATNTPDGLVYFLPRRPFVVTVTSGNVSEAGNVSAAGNMSMPGNVSVSGSSHAVTVSQGMAEADLRQRFVVSQGTNWLAKTELNVTVGANGLLKTNNTSVTSEVAQALQNAASAIGTIVAGVPTSGPLAVSGEVSQLNIGCPPPGSTYQYLLYPESDGPVTTFCGYTVAWTRLTPPNRQPNANFAPMGSATKYSGLFYKPELPYYVTVTAPAVPGNQPAVQSWVLTSPDEAEIAFFHVHTSFFANNSANISLSEGIITGVDQTTEGELTSALSLPASVLGSYTSAIGNVLGNLTTNSKDTASLLAQQNATAAVQAQSALCRATIAANPITPGMSSTQLMTAYTAISTGCASQK